MADSDGQITPGAWQQAGASPYPGRVPGMPPADDTSASRQQAARPASPAAGVPPYANGTQQVPAQGQAASYSSVQSRPYQQPRSPQAQPGYPASGQYSQQARQGYPSRGQYPAQAQSAPRGQYPQQSAPGARGHYPSQGAASARPAYPPQNQHAAQGQYPPRQQGAPRGQYQPQGQGAPRGQYPQGAGARVPYASQQGQSAPAGRYAQGGHPQGTRPGAGQAQGYRQGQYQRAAYNPDNQRGAANYGRAAYANGAQGQAGSRGGSGRPGRQGQMNVQLVDENGAGRFGRTTNAGAYGKEYGTGRSKVFRFVIIGIIVLVLAAIVFAVVKVGGILGNLYNESQITKEEQEKLDSILAQGKATEPFYMLLMGTDSDSVRTEDGYVGQNSDSMMLVRVDAPNRKVTLISVLRDTWVDTTQWDESTWALVNDRYRGYVTSEIKINSCNVYGGPALAVACVSQLTGLPISHYAEIDMDGFVSLVNAVGGIEVNIPVALYDEKLDDGSDQTYQFDAGWQTLNGEQALSLCRMRYAYEALDREQGWGGDVYRAANQRMVISALMKKILSLPLNDLMSAVQDLVKYVSIDDNLGVSDLVSLATAFKDIDISTDIYSTRIPTTGGYLDTDRWKVMVDRMEQGLSPVTEDVVDESTGTILQSSGSGGISDLNEIDQSANTEEEASGEGENASEESSQAA